MPATEKNKAAKQLNDSLAASEEARAWNAGRREEARRIRERRNEQQEREKDRCVVREEPKH